MTPDRRRWLLKLKIIRIIKIRGRQKKRASATLVLIQEPGKYKIIKIINDQIFLCYGFFHITPLVSFL